MEQEEENLQNEPGSMQRQTQNIDGDEKKDGEDTGEFGIIPAPEVEGSDADKDREAAVDFENEANLEEADDDEVTSSAKARRNPWNSITFDSDDFFAGLTPA